MHEKYGMGLTLGKTLNVGGHEGTGMSRCLLAAGMKCLLTTKNTATILKLREVCN